MDHSEGGRHSWRTPEHRPTSHRKRAYFLYDMLNCYIGFTSVFAFAGQENFAGSANFPDSACMDETHGNKGAELQPRSYEASVSSQFAGPVSLTEISSCTVTSVEARCNSREHYCCICEALCLLATFAHLWSKLQIFRSHCRLRHAGRLPRSAYRLARSGSDIA